MGLPGLVVSLAFPHMATSMVSPCGRPGRLDRSTSGLSLIGRLTPRSFPQSSAVPITYGESDLPVGGTSSRTSSTRGALKIAAAKLEDHGKVLALTTDPHSVAATYRLELPAIRSEGATDQGAPVKVQYELSRC